MAVSPYSRRRIITALLAVTMLASCGFERESAPAPVSFLGTGTNAALNSVSGAVMVQGGDTVSQLSERYRLPARDIIETNNLQAPYALSAGQRIVLPTPVEHKVAQEDTLYRLSRMYGVPVSQLVQTNHLSAPYRLNVGQTIRIPQGAKKFEQEAVTISPKSSVIESVELAPPSTARYQTVAPQPMVMAKPVTTVLGSQRPDFSWPVRGRVVSNYGPKTGGLYNDGINIAAPKGTPVAAAADGIVAYVGNGLDSYGNLVLIKHSGGMVTAYAHMASVNVSKGVSIRKGQTIGTVGSTGTVVNAQLHFEVRRGAETLDPKKFLG